MHKGIEGAAKVSALGSARRVARWLVTMVLSVVVVSGALTPAAHTQMPPAPQLPKMPAIQLPQGSQLPPAPKLPPAPQLNLPDIPGAPEGMNSSDLLPGQRPGAPGAPGKGNQGPRNVILSNVPSRTSMAVIMPWGTIRTPNAYESRPGLSIVKLYLADYVLRKVKRSDRNWQLAQRMIQFSDDHAASILDRKYPQAINAVAREYGLSATSRGVTWGKSSTSAMDTARYLDRVRKTRPQSLILQWMRSASPVAADGTAQNWGTATLPGVTGSKWGWSDYGSSTVASASIAPNYTAAAFTYGGAGTQNVDVRSAIAHIR